MLRSVNCLAVVSVLVVTISGTAQAVLTTSTDIGTPADWPNPGDPPDPQYLGSFSYAPGTGQYTVNGGGSDIWFDSDHFHYVYEPLSGDGQVTVQVLSITNTDTWVKAGVMIREMLATGSRHAMSVMTVGQGHSFQRRHTTGDQSWDTTTPGLSVPYWVRLERDGDQFIAYSSSDGINWEWRDSETISMAADAYVGLCVTAHNNDALPVCQAVFSDYELVNFTNLIWKGNGPGSWDSATEWEGGDPGDVPDVNTNTTVQKNVVTVDGATGGAARKLTVVNNGGTGGIAISAGKTLTVATEVDFEPKTTLGFGPGAKLVVGTGGVIGDLTTAGNATIDTGGDVSVGTYNDGGIVAGTFTKQGAGTLWLDNSFSGGVVAHETTFKVEAGTLASKGPYPLGWAEEVILDGGTLMVEGDTQVVRLYNTLTHSGYMEASADENLDFQGNGGLLAATPAGSALFTDGPGGRGLDFNSDADFTNAGVGITRNNDFQNTWTGEFNPPLSGTYDFRIQNPNNDGTFWIDLDRDRVFENGEEIIWASYQFGQNLVDGAAYLEGGRAYNIAIGHAERTFFSAMEVLFKTPSGGGVETWTMIKPGDPAQATLWSTASEATLALDMADTDVTVTDDSTLDAVTNFDATFGALTLGAGVLTTSGADGGITFTSTTIPQTAAEVGLNCQADTDPGHLTIHAGVLTTMGRPVAFDGTTIPATAAAVGLNPQVDTDYGVIDGNGADVTITKSGPIEVVLDQANQDLGSATFDVHEGTLVIDGAAAWGGATKIRLSGGMLTLSALADGTAGGDPDTLAEQYYSDSYGPTMLSGLGAGGGYFAETPAYSGKYDQADLNLDTAEFLARSDNSLSLEGNGTPVSFGAVWLGALTIGAAGDPDARLTAGQITFGTSSDDGSIIFIDGVDIGLGQNQDQSTTTRTATVNLAEGDHSIIVGYYENAGDNHLEAKFGQGAGLDYDTQMAFIHPGKNDGSQDGLWSESFVPNPVDMQAHTVSVTDGGTLNPLTGAAVAFGALSLENGILRTAGAAGGISFTSTTISPGSDVTEVGFDTQVDTTPGTIDAGGNAITIVKTGPADLILDQAGRNLNEAEFDVQEGRLIGVRASNPFGGATLQLGGGEAVLSTKATGLPLVAFSNDVIVEADSMLTAGAAGGGAAGPQTVVLCGNNGVVLNNGVLALASTDDYGLFVVGPLSGRGGISVARGDVTLVDGGDIVSAAVTGGSLSIGDELEVETMTVTGGRMNTNAYQVALSNSLKLSDVTYTISEHPTFSAQGTDLIHGAELTLSGGVLSIGDSPLEFASQDIGVPGLAGSYSYNPATDEHTVVGDGGDIWDDGDQFRYAYVPVVGDVDIVAHVSSLVGEVGDLHEWAKAGVMVRDNLSNNGAHGFTAQTGTNGLRPQGRPVSGANGNCWNGDSFGNSGEPYWLRVTLETTTDTVHQYRSSDPPETDPAAVNWGAEIYSRQLTDDGDDVWYAGLAVTAHDNGRLAGGVFSSVMINGVVVGMAPDSIDAPNTDLVALKDAEVDSAASHVTLGDLTMQGGAGTLTLSGAAYSFKDVTTPDGATIEGDLSVRGILSPGDSPGTLNVDGGLTMNETSTYQWELGDLAGDVVGVDGELLLKYGWKLELHALGSLMVGADEEFHLFTFGEDGYLAFGSDISMDWEGALQFIGEAWDQDHPDWDPTLRSHLTGVRLSGVVAVPEPGTLLLLASGGIVLLLLWGRRRCAFTCKAAASGGGIPRPMVAALHESEFPDTLD